MIEGKISGKNEKDHFQVGLEVEVGGVESVLSATVVEIERNQGRIANPGPKVILLLLSMISLLFLLFLKLLRSLV